MVVTFFSKHVLDELSLVKPGLVWAYKTLRLLNGLRKILNYRDVSPGLRGRPCWLGSAALTVRTFPNTP